MIPVQRHSVQASSDSMGETEIENHGSQRRQLFRMRAGGKEEQPICCVSVRATISPHLGLLTFAHQMPLPSTARSQTCANANTAPALHASRCAGLRSNKEPTRTRNVASVQSAAHATALVKRACLEAVAMEARMEARKRASGRVVVSGDRAPT